MVTDPFKAYYHLAPPFLNRFEKHTLDWEDILGSESKQVLQEVTQWAKSLCTEVVQFGPRGNANPATTFSLQNLFYGYHWQYMSSLVAVLGYAPKKDSIHAIVGKCKSELMWMIRPEAIVHILWATVTKRYAITIDNKAKPKVGMALRNRCIHSLSNTWLSIKCSHWLSWQKNKK